MDLETYHPKYNRAIVIGGSMAGLPAAQVLTRYFHQVIIIDRDHFPHEPAPRKGAPQANHLHLLWKRGQLILEELFPGLTQDLIQAGAIEINWGSDVAFYSGGGRRPSYNSGIATLSCSRGLLEYAIRTRLTLNPQIQFKDGWEVVELIVGNGKVKGVQLQSRDGNRKTGSLEADLLVDCSGRSSNTLQWLTQLNYPTPRKEVVNAFVGYACRIYKQVPGMAWKAMAIPTEPPTKTRGVYIVPLEGGRWQLGVQGYNRDYPPTNEREFNEYIRSAGVPDFEAAIEKAEPLSPIIGYRHTENCLYHFEELAPQLENFLVLGDAVMTSNPAYGLGMSVALIETQNLNNCLVAAQDLTGLSSTFQKQIYQSILPYWNRAINFDSNWPDCEGAVINTDPNAPLVKNYMTQVFKASPTNFILLEALTGFTHLVADDTIFFRPDIVLQVIAEMTGLGRPIETAGVPG